MRGQYQGITTVHKIQVMYGISHAIIIYIINLRLQSKILHKFLCMGIRGYILYNVVSSKKVKL